MKFFSKLYQRYFGVAESAAVVSKKPAYYYEVYTEGDTHVFTWFSENHAEGAIHGYTNRELTLVTRDRWLEDMRVKGNLVVPVGAA